MSSATLTINSIRSAYPSDWDNSFNGMVVAGNISVFMGYKQPTGDPIYERKNCRTKLKFTVGSNLLIGSCNSLLFKVKANRGYPNLMKACLAKNDVTVVGNILDSDGNEINTNNVESLAYSQSYSDPGGTTRFSGSVSSGGYVYFKFNLANVTLEAGKSYYIYVYRSGTSTNINTSVSIYGAGTYGASESSNISNYELTLDYTLPSYTVSVNKGTGISNVSVERSYIHGSSVTVSATAENGYTFSHWTYNGNAYYGSPWTVTSSITGNISIGAFATANSYTVTYNGNGGTPKEASKTVKYNDKYGTLTTATRSGYTFAGWYTSDGTQVTSSSTYTEASNITLYAHWTANAYKITYNGNGGYYSYEGITTETWSEYVTYGSWYALWPNNRFFERPGYKFVGWNTKADGTGEDWTDWVRPDGVPTNNLNSETPGVRIWTYAHDNTVVYAMWEAQATMFVKHDDKFVAGTPFLKTSNGWERAVNVFVKCSDGSWKRSIR